MARTDHSKRGKAKHRPLSKESTANRRATVQLYRALANAAVRCGHYDAIPVFKGTCGWETW